MRAGRLWGECRRPVLVATVGLMFVLAALPAAFASHLEAERSGGGNRYETAAAIAEHFVPFGTDTAFLARGDRFPDALVASFGSGHADAPVLLTRRGDVPQATLESLESLDVDEIVLLGKRQAIAPAVATRLRRAGYTVERLGGSDRYETAATVATRYGTPAAERVGTVDGKRTALLAGGTSFYDVLVAAPLAAGAHFPLLLTGQEGYPPSVSEALRSLDVEQVLIVGDTTAVTHAVHQQLEEEGYTVQRLGDPDEQRTAAVVTQFAIYDLRWPLDEVFLADGRSFASALTVAPLAGLSRGTVMLTDSPATDFAEQWLTELCPRVGSVRALGGPEAVPRLWHQDAVEAADACQH